MKKILFAGASAAALLAVPALAQNNQSTVNQTGSGAAAEVSQTGENDRSTVTQSGGGTVQIDQQGVTGSTSTVTTSADDRPPESIVQVTQSDDGSSSEATGQANVSTVIQDNVNGFGTTGTGSTVTVDQEHNEAGTGQNSSYVQQGRNAVSGQVTVSQTGGENVSNYTSTTSTDNDAIIGQTGVGNYSDVQQDFQNGSAVANVDQNGTGGGVNSVYIDQISAGFATNPAQFAVGADASATQDGSGNMSTISQTGYSTSDATANYASSDQVGDDNTSEIRQPGTDNMATVSQTGDLHYSQILQGGNGNTAEVSQNGNGHSSIIDQDGSNNVATVGQSSSGNMSTVNQGGNGNTATVTQGGAPGGGV